MSAEREEAFGQGYAPTAVDRFGVWLSARQIRRFAPSFAGKRIADLGCGYHAAFTRTVLDQVSSALLVDVDLASDLVQHPKVRAIRGGLPESLAELPGASLDIVMIVSVLEHLWEPLQTLQEIRRLLAPGGTCLVNVPSWRGKHYLELSAFKLGLSPASEMDDHKIYYDVKDLWPLLVKAGWRPSEIQCFSHKFGLNTFAACRLGG
ncbi:MAG: class I SAM-dependent methyltransferase [Polyangiaceae bacterium]|nr:class I SAM-dependent methyltransferase [Polyangiaceae bacterium]